MFWLKPMDLFLNTKRAKARSIDGDIVFKAKTFLKNT